MDFSHLSEPLIASMIGALATVAAALVQLRISWRRDMNERKQIETEVQRADASHLGEEGAMASVVVGPCKPEGVPGAKQECTEQSALRVAICARVPASATVREVQLYVRAANSKQPWEEARVQAGQDAGQARFADKFTERPGGDAGKDICQGFANWSGEKSRTARILVNYAL